MRKEQKRNNQRKKMTKEKQSKREQSLNRKETRGKPRKRITFLGRRGSQQRHEPHCIRITSHTIDMTVIVMTMVGGYFLVGFNGIVLHQF